jgi:hypothetical protein
MKPKAHPEAQSAQLVESMVEVINDLAATMLEEIRLLKKPDSPVFQENLRKKNKLIIRYQAGMKTIATQPELLKMTTEESRSRLKASGMKLAGATEHNAKALQGAVQGTKRLIEHIMNHVRQEALPQLGYTDPRKDRFALGSYSPICRPVAVSRTA